MGESTVSVQKSPIVRSISTTSIAPPRGQVFDTPLSRSKSEVISFSQSTRKRVRRVTSKYAGPAGQVTEQEFYAAFSKVDDHGVRTKRDAANLMQTIRTSFVSPSEHWEKRVDALIVMRSVVMNPISMEEFWAEAKPLELKLRYCLKSLRSQLIREACITIAFFAIRLKAKFSRIAEGLLPDLLSLVQNHANVVSSSASIAAEFIFKNTQSSRLLPVLMLCFESKSREIRSACCNMLFVLLHYWPKDELKKQKKAISTFVSIALADADPNARSCGREAFVIFNELFPDEGRLLLERLDETKKRQLKAIFSDMTSDRTPSVTAGKSITKKWTAPQSAVKTKIPQLANFNETSADERFRVTDILSSAHGSKVRTKEAFSADGTRELYEGSTCTKPVNVNKDSGMVGSLESFADTPITKALQNVSTPSLLPLSMISTPSFLQAERNGTSFTNDQNVLYDSAFGYLPYERACNEFANRSKCIVQAHAEREEDFCRDNREESPMLIKLEDSFIRPPVNISAPGTKEYAFQRRPSKGGRAFFSSCLLEQIPGSPFTTDESGLNPEENYLFSLNNSQPELIEQKAILNTDSPAKPIHPYVNDAAEEERKMGYGNLANKVSEKEDGEEADALVNGEEKTYWPIILVESDTDGLISVAESPYAKSICVDKSNDNTADPFNETTSVRCATRNKNQNGNEEKSHMIVSSESADTSVTVSHCEPGNDTVEDEACSEFQVHEEDNNDSAEESSEIVEEMDGPKVHEEASSNSAKKADESVERMNGLETQVPMQKEVPIDSPQESYKTNETIETLDGTEVHVQAHEAVTNDSDKEDNEIVQVVHETEVQGIVGEEVLNDSSGQTSTIINESDGREVRAQKIAKDSAKETSEIMEAVDGTEAHEVLDSSSNEFREVMERLDGTEAQMQVEEEIPNESVERESIEVVERPDRTQVHEEILNGSSIESKESVERLDGIKTQLQVEENLNESVEKETNEVVEIPDRTQVQAELHEDIAVDSFKETSKTIKSLHGPEAQSTQSAMREEEFKNVEPTIQTAVECSVTFARQSDTSMEDRNAKAYFSIGEHQVAEADAVYPDLFNGGAQELIESSAGTSILSEDIVWEEAKSRRLSVESMPFESEGSDSFLTANRDAIASDISLQNLTEPESKRQYKAEEALQLISQLKTSNDFRTKKASIEALLKGCVDEQFDSAAMYEIGNALLSMYTSSDSRLRNGACQLWAYLLCVSETFRKVVLSKSIDHMIIWLKCLESDEEGVLYYLKCILAILSHSEDWTLSLKKSILWKLVERICDWQNVLTDRAEAFQLLHFVIHNARKKFFTSDEEIAAYVQKLIEGVFHDAVAKRFFITLLLQIHSIYPVTYLECMIKQQAAKSVHEEYVQFLCASVLVRETSN